MHRIFAPRAVVVADVLALSLAAAVGLGLAVDPLRRRIRRAS
jgi:hypothetical protein